MNTLTKVFITLMLVFSIAFTVLTVQFMAKVPEWRNEAIQWKSRAQQVDTHNRHLVALKVAESARADLVRQDLEQQKAALADQQRALQSQLDELKARLAKAEADATAKDGTIKKLTAELSIAQAGAEKARQHRDELVKENTKLQESNLNLTEVNNERIANIIVLEQLSRQQEQEINILKSEVNKLAKRVGQPLVRTEEQIVGLPGDQIQAATPPKIAPIRGQIDAIADDYATISLGSNDGVEPGMVFIIYSDENYLGDLVITDVEPQTAAGQLKNVTGQIRIGDFVAEESSYLAMN